MGRARCRCGARLRVCETFQQSSFPRRRESTGGGAAMGSRLHGNDGRRRAHPQSSARIHGTHNRHSRDGGNPRGGAGDGFPSARERRAATAHPQSSFPRESTAATIVIPATAGIHGGGAAMGSRLHGNDGRRRPHPQSSARIHGSHNRHSRDGGNPRRGAGDGFPSARERRAAAGAPTIVGENPRPHNRHSRDGGNPRGGAGDGFPSARERRAAAGAPTIVGENPRHPQSSFPRRRESTGGAGDGFPSARERRAAGAPTIVGENPRTHNRHSRDGGNPRRGAGDGFPSARERRAAAGAPTIVGENPRPHNRHSRDGGNPRGGGGDGFPSARERRAAAAHPQSSARIHGPTIVIPATAGIHGGGAAMGSRLHGNDGRRRRTHNRHSREWSYARVSLSGNDGARPCGSWSCTRAGRRPSPSRSRRRCWASGLWRSRPPARRRA